MKYVEFLRLLAKFGDKLPQALAILAVIKEQFSLLFDLLQGGAPKLGVSETHAAFIGPQELVAESYIEAQFNAAESARFTSSAIAAAEGDGAAIVGAGKLDFSSLREIFVWLKDSGLIAIFMSVLTRASR